MSSISKTTLGDLIEFQRGYDLPKTQFIDGEYPVQSSNGILGFHNEFKVKGPGITIGRSGTVGLPHLIKSNFYPHNTALFIKDFKGNNVEYIYYLLKNLKLGNKKSGSGVPTMNRNHLHPLKIVAHLDSPTQQAIAKVLSDLDAKIELNNKINRKLEAMAKTLYDYWFVQFDFPNEQGKAYKSSGGKMVFNEELKREIPEGWTVKSLEDLTNKIGDGIHGTPQYVDNSSYHFINGNNLIDGFIQFDKDTKKVSQAEYEKYFIDLNSDSILLSINGTLGNLAVFTNEKVMLGKSSAYINCKENHRAFCYLFLKQEHIQKTFWLIATGSTIKNLSLASLKKLKLAYSGIEILKEFDNIINPIDDKRENIFKQNQQLTALRDWLLPMLMNGQVTVGEAEEKLSMAAEPQTEYKKG